MCMIQHTLLFNCPQHRVSSTVEAKVVDRFDGDFTHESVDAEWMAIKVTR